MLKANRQKPVVLNLAQENKYVKGAITDMGLHNEIRKAIWFSRLFFGSSLLVVLMSGILSMNSLYEDDKYFEENGVIVEAIILTRSTYAAWLRYEYPIGQYHDQHIRGIPLGWAANPSVKITVDKNNPDIIKKIRRDTEELRGIYGSSLVRASILIPILHISLVLLLRLSARRKEKMELETTEYGSRGVDR